MKGSVTAHPVSLFGKRSPDRDYEWLGGRNAMPERISAACEQVVRISNETGALVSLVAAADEEVFLARTFRQGIDGAYRPILALEVLRADSEPAPPDWPALARGALDERSLETAGSGGPATVELPASRSSAGPPPAGDVLDRIRLGLPVSVDTPEAARAILAEHPGRYLGVVYALRMRGGTPVPWRPELTSFLAIQWGQAVLSPDEEESLRLLARRRPTAEEWSRLSAVPPETIRRALRWALSPDETSPPIDGDAGLVPWLVAFRRATAGGELLSLLRRDLGDRPLGPPVLDDAFPGLSPAARAALADGADPAGCPSDEIGLPVLEELAAQGLLDEGSSIPPQRWIHYVRGSKALAGAALTLLRHRGIDEAWARTLLCLPADDARLRPEEAAAAVEAARALGLPLPLDALRQLIASGSEHDLEAAVALGHALGGKALDLAQLLNTGRLPDEEPDPDDLALVLSARSRGVPSLNTLSLAAELLNRGWATAVQAVLDAEERRDLPSLPSLARGALRARLGDAPPPAVKLAEVQSLIRHDLVRPGDVVPERPEELAGLADLWAETRPLAAVLRGSGKVPLPGSCPGVWLPSLRQALTPDRAEAWLSGLGPGEIPAARSWLCQVQELPASVVGLFKPERPRRIDGATLRPVLPWVVPLAGPAELDERIEILSRLAQSRVLERDDHRAAALAEELVPEADGEIRELAVHLLSKVGPLPSLSTIRPEVVVALVPSMDSVSLVNALFVAPRSPSTDSPQLVDAVFRRVQKAGASCPPHGYTTAQIERHPELAARLSGLEGWKALAPDTLDFQPVADAESPRQLLDVREDNE